MRAPCHSATRTHESSDILVATYNERLSQRIYDTHPVSVSAVWKLPPDQVLARLPEILEREPE